MIYISAGLLTAASHWASVMNHLTHVHKEPSPSWKQPSFTIAPKLQSSSMIATLYIYAKIAMTEGSHCRFGSSWSPHGDCWMLWMRACWELCIGYWHALFAGKFAEMVNRGYTIPAWVCWVQRFYEVEVGIIHFVHTPNFFHEGASENLLHFGQSTFQNDHAVITKTEKRRCTRV